MGNISVNMNGSFRATAAQLQNAENTEVRSKAGDIYLRSASGKSRLLDGIKEFFGSWGAKRSDARIALHAQLGGTKAGAALHNIRGKLEVAIVAKLFESAHKEKLSEVKAQKSLEGRIQVLTAERVNLGVDQRILDDGKRYLLLKGFKAEPTVHNAKQLLVDLKSNLVSASRAETLLLKQLDKFVNPPAGTDTVILSRTLGSACSMAAGGLEKKLNSAIDKFVRQSDLGPSTRVNQYA